MRATRRPRVVLPDSVRLIPRGEEPRVAGRGESAEAARDARVARPPPRGGDPFRVARRELPRDLLRCLPWTKTAACFGSARAPTTRRRCRGAASSAPRSASPSTTASPWTCTCLTSRTSACSDSRRRWPTCASSLRASGEVSRRCWRCAATAATTTTRTSRTRCRAISCTNTSTRAPARFDRWR